MTPNDQPDAPRCRYGVAGLPACTAGTRGSRWWCAVCAPLLDPRVIAEVTTRLHPTDGPDDDASSDRELRRQLLARERDDDEAARQLRELECVELQLSLDLPVPTRKGWNR